MHDGVYHQAQGMRRCDPPRTRNSVRWPVGDRDRTVVSLNVTRPLALVNSLLIGVNINRVDGREWVTVGDQVSTAQSRAVSTRLIQVLQTYCHGLHGGALRDLRDSIANGHYRWLQDELHAALAQEAFTPELWVQYVGAIPGAETGRRTMRHQQHQVWRVVLPDRPFPGR